MYREDAQEDRSLLVVAFNRRALAFEARTGSIRWEVELGTAFMSGTIELVIHRGHVYACCRNQIVCLEYATGRKVGEAQLPVAYPDRPAIVVQDDLMFVACGGEVVCLDLNGQVLWHDPLKGRGLGRAALGFPGNVRQADDRGSQ